MSADTDWPDDACLMLSIWGMLGSKRWIVRKDDEGQFKVRREGKYGRPPESVTGEVRLAGELADLMFEELAELSFKPFLMSGSHVEVMDMPNCGVRFRDEQVTLQLNWVTAPRAWRPMQRWHDRYTRVLDSLVDAS